MKNDLKKTIRAIAIICAFAWAFCPHAAHADITTGLIGWWKMDEASSGTCSGTTADSSGSGNTGTCVGSPTYISGKIGLGALSFNGSTQYVTIPAQQWPQSGFTASTWMYVPSYQGADFMSVYCGGTCSPNGAYLQFFVDGNGAVHGRIQQVIDTTYVGRVTNYSAFTTGTWHLFTMTWNGGTSNSSIAIYVDGSEVDTGDDGGGSFTSPYTGSSLLMWLGGQNYSGGNSFLNGYMDDSRIYNRALSASDVTQLYNYTGLPTGSFSRFIVRLKRFVVTLGRRLNIK